MKKWIVFFATELIIGQSFAWESMAPKFLTNGDVVFAAQGGACGRVQLELKEGVELTYKDQLGDLVVRSYRTNYANDDYNFDARKLGEIVYAGVPQVFSYDWAGPVKQVYRLQCFVRTNIAQKEYTMKKDCGDVITMKSIYHNGSCKPWHRVNGLNTSIFKKPVK